MISDIFPSSALALRLRSVLFCRRQFHRNITPVPGRTISFRVTVLVIWRMTQKNAAVNKMNIIVSLDSINLQKHCLLLSFLNNGNHF